ncbi:hypothetical protein ACS0X5_09295 [Burkholderia gladioli]|uniref:hypothetical protein n=1 Tax=Burkholderia gladioli TaxID=28095 RepID=UPI003B97FEEA
MIEAKHGRPHSYHEQRLRERRPPPDKQFEGRPASIQVPAYCDSKRTNLVFARELARELLGGGANVMSLAAHPGYSPTNLQYGAGNKMHSAALAGIDRT